MRKSTFRPAGPQRCRDDVLREVLTNLANILRERGATDERESFIDAMFLPAKGSGDKAAPSGRDKVLKIKGIFDRYGLPLAVSTLAANHHEVTLACIVILLRQS